MINKIYTLTLNPSIDYIVKTGDIKLGETNKAEYEMSVVGGKGINVARVINTLGLSTKAVGIAGGYTGREIIRQLDNMGIENDFVMTDKSSRINIKLQTNCITEINGKGPVVTDDEIKILTDKLKDAELIVMSGSIPQGVDSNIYADIAKKLNIPFVLDCTGETFLNAVLEKPVLVKPNKAELEEMFNTKINDYDTAILYGDKLVEMGAENVIVSMGEKGAVFTDGKISYVAVGVKGDVINTVGAGDSMTAGFVYGYVTGMDKKYAFNLASACGTACAFSKDLPDRDFIFGILNEKF